ncbi:hypothetical protein OBBRIDRAFT_188779 [Obba rivulosa]|uniref:Aip3p/Bud6 N-terminal domain-containing protein n=1 Tax=Obba rivulosa TaxID=1052685 RepID=A0A8E2DHF7_9APHY|nr:hypothetical protein OBBRIDRAFT_188779 [Obba rivulosa]
MHAVYPARMQSVPMFVRSPSGDCGWRSTSPDSTYSAPSFTSMKAHSDVHNAVSRLLGLTKQLQDVLQLWGLRRASEEQVSDAFVLVGAQFSTTVNLFWQHQIDMSDLSHTLVDLRMVLESCLGEDPSPMIVDRYMPEVRRVLYDLLQGLRSKQGPYWAAIYGRRSASPGDGKR